MVRTIQGVLSLVKFRLFIDALEEQFWFFHTPGFECINRRKMAESAPRGVLGADQLHGGAAAGLLQKLNT